MSKVDFEIPGYDIVEPVGKGGMATVYRARQHTFDRNVALKILKPDLSEDESFGIRFINESLIVAKLNHSHIVQVYDVGEVQNRYFISMEYLSGGDLNSRLKNGLSEANAVKIVKQMASALDFAHQRGIVHRDMKPENVMFREDGASVLTDFGIAKETNQDLNLTETGMIVGTPKYMSPEQIKGVGASPAGDIYSLGIMFYQLLVGRVPFKGADFMATAYMHFNEPVPLLPSQYHRYQGLIEHMLAKDVADRIESAGKVAAALEEMEKQDYAKYRPGQNDSPNQPVSADETVMVNTGHVESINDTHARNTAETVIAEKENAGVAETIATQINPHSINADAKSRSDSRASEGPPGIVKYVAIGLVTLVCVAGGVVYMSQGDVQSEYDATTARAEEGLDQGLSEVRKLLKQAKKDIDALRLTVGDNNAYSKLQKVLQLEPENAQAKLGMQEIAKKYIELATQAIENRNVDAADDYIRSAQRVAPDISVKAVEQRLVSLQDDIRSSSEEYILSVKQRMQVSGLLQAAKIDEQEGRLYTPEGDNAYEKYQRILAIDRSNQAAQDAIAKLKKQRP